MTEAKYAAEILRFEQARADYLFQHKGALDGFHDEPEGEEQLDQHLLDRLMAHLRMPGFYPDLALSSPNRRILGPAIIPSTQRHDLPRHSVTIEHIEQARQYVSELLDVELGDVTVILPPPTEMPADADGVVYPNGPTRHIVVVPECCHDPVLVLVRQFGIAAHYTVVRRRPGLVGLVSDTVTQELIGHYCQTRYAVECGDAATMAEVQTRLVAWEVARGLIHSPRDQLAFIGSDLGSSMLQDYGGEFMQDLISGLFEGYTLGQGLVHGQACFMGAAIALALHDEPNAILTFLNLDRSDRSLDEKLAEALGADYAPGSILAFTEKLAALIEPLAPQPAEEGGSLVDGDGAAEPGEDAAPGPGDADAGPGADEEKA